MLIFYNAVQARPSNMNRYNFVQQVYNSIFTPPPSHWACSAFHINTNDSDATAEPYSIPIQGVLVTLPFPVRFCATSIWMLVSSFNKYYFWI